MKHLIFLLCLLPIAMQPALAQKKDSVRIEYSEEDRPDNFSSNNFKEWAGSGNLPGDFTWNYEPYCLEWLDKGFHIDIPDIDINIPDLDFYFDWNCKKRNHLMKKMAHKKRKASRRKTGNDSIRKKINKYYFSTPEDENEEKEDR